MKNELLIMIQTPLSVRRLTHAKESQIMRNANFFPINKFKLSQP